MEVELNSHEIHRRDHGSEGNRDVLRGRVDPLLFLQTSQNYFPFLVRVEPQIQAVASFGIAKPPYCNGIPELRAIPESFFAALIVANFILLALFRNLPLAVPFCTKMANRILMS